MLRKKEKIVMFTDFADQTPKMQIEKLEPAPFFEKAFPKNNDNPSSDFNLNTEAWD